MGTIVIKRPVRPPAPELPTGEVVLEAPPQNPPPPQRAWSQALMVLPMMAGSAATMLMFAGNRAGPMAYVTGALFGVSMLGMVGASVFTGGGGPGKKEMVQARRQYLRSLAQQRRTVRRTIERQRTAIVYRNPAPDTLWSIAAGARLWERRHADGDFAVIRIGVGPQKLATPLVPPQSRPIEDLEPLCAKALRSFIVAHATVPDLPIAATLRGFARIYLTGAPEATRALARSIVAQYATFHAPDDALVVVCRSISQAAQWDWTRWLPHAQHPTAQDALGPMRLIGGSLRVVEEHLEDVVGTRPRFNPHVPPVDGHHVLVLLDGGDPRGCEHLMTEGGVDGVTILDLSGQPPRHLDQSTLVLDIDAGGTLRSHTHGGTDELGKPDAMSVGAAEGLARQLAPFRLVDNAGGVGDERAVPTDLDLAELLRLGDPRLFDPASVWSVPRPNRDRLRVPIGLSPQGLPVELDIKESAQEGMGPHGLLIGATGSGKSEYLRTLVLALAATHSSEILNFVLVDFKGGATFTRLDHLPHTSAVITNLADEIALVDRMEDAINGELLRRQELLRSAGNYASQRDYERARAAGRPLAPLPSLLIVCDEFSELLTAKPDFIDMFVQIGRVGRSLGIHLLLASQRLEEGRLRGLDTHLSYRIGLRTFSAGDSRAVLGSDDAYHLPRSPGHGYLRFGTEPLVQFKAAYVSGAYSDAGPLGVAAAVAQAEIGLFTTDFVPLPAEPDAHLVVREETDEDVLADSLLDIMVARMQGQGVAAHQVWLPPLDEPATLDELLALNGTGHGGLRVPVGIVDKPLEQRRDLFLLNLAGGGGHLAVVGAAQSGKSTLLRTLICGAALTHKPTETQFYCIDLGGGTLLGLRDLPHVGGVATRREADQIRRTVAEVAAVLEERERFFATHGIDSMGTYRRRRASGEFADDPFGDVFLIVDGWGAMRNDFEDTAEKAIELAARGLSYGIHLVVTAVRWGDIRYNMRDLFGNKVELRLGDPSDSEHGGRAASNVPEERPGRGLTADAMHFLTALPRIDGTNNALDLADGIAQLVSQVRQAWPGVATPQVRMLPDKLPYRDLPTPADEGYHPHRVPVGIAEADLKPVYLDFAAEPHFVMLSDVESGKSTFLRGLAHRLQEHFTPEQAQIMVVDYRRSLLGTVGPQHLFTYCSSQSSLEEAVRQICVGFDRRLPPEDITVERLRARDWWRGPEMFILVDDYDMLTGAMMHPLEPLVPYLSQARDIGMHLIVTRRTGGAGRALYDPILGRLRELSAPGFVGSGSRDEGGLIGEVRPSDLPPGRGSLVTRREGARLVQLAWVDPDL